MNDLLIPVFVETARFLFKDKSENTFIKYVRQGWLAAISLTDTKISIFFGMIVSSDYFIWAGRNDHTNCPRSD